MKHKVLAIIITTIFLSPFFYGCEKKEAPVPAIIEVEQPKPVPPKPAQKKEITYDDAEKRDGYPYEAYRFPIVDPDYPPEINPDTAQELIKERVSSVVQAIMNKDLITLSDFIHPEKGVRFSITARFDAEKPVIKKEEIPSMFSDEQQILWGRLAPSGTDLILTKKEYFDTYILRDFSKAVKIGYNEIITYNGYPQYQFRDYPNSIIVEYGFPNEKGPFDWEGYRIVFQQFENEWYVVAFLRSTHYQ